LTGSNIKGGNFDTTGDVAIGGNLDVAGSITNYNKNANATSAIKVANNGMDIVGASNTVDIVSDNNADAKSGRAQVHLSTDKATGNSTASVTATNNAGNKHGLVVDNNNTNATVLSGGTTDASSTSLTLNDSGASFANPTTGTPSRVSGVADGVQNTDAVNVQQLNRTANQAYSGIAQVAAMQSIPEPIAGHKYSFGMGSGFYSGQQALAFGGKANIGNHARVGASVATGFGTSREMAASLGAGFSW
jgi:autotransporter adhesin